MFNPQRPGFSGKTNQPPPMGSLPARSNSTSGAYLTFLYHMRQVRPRNVKWEKITVGSAHDDHLASEDRRGHFVALCHRPHLGWTEEVVSDGGQRSARCNGERPLLHNGCESIVS